MKKFQRFCTLFLLMIGLCSFALHAQSYAGLWRQVEQAQKKSLPQTVVKLTEKIYRKAELEKNAPQMLKAYICREAYQERLTPDSLYTNLKKLESWVESEKNLVNKAILHSLLSLEFQVMYSHHRLDSTVKFIAISEIIQIDRNQSCLPVMAVNDVWSEIDQWKCT